MKYVFLINRFSLRERLDKYIKAIKEVTKSFELDYSYSTNTIRSFYMEGYLLRK